MKWTQLSIQRGRSARSPEFRRSTSNHSRVIPFRYDWAKVTFALSRQNALARSWKHSSHWTRKVLSFFGSIPSKVSSSQTWAREKEELLVQWEERERRLTAIARFWNTARPGSSSSVASTNSSLSSSLLLSSLGSSGVSQSVDLGQSNNLNTTPTKDYEKVQVVVYLCGVQRGCAEEGERGSTPKG